MKNVMFLSLFLGPLLLAAQTTKPAPGKDEVVDYSRKLLMGEEKSPLVNQRVVLMDPVSAKSVEATTDKYGDFTLKGLKVKSTYKMEIPIDTFSLTRPIKEDTLLNSFNIDYNPAEYPELAAYKGVFFEVAPENKTFDKSYYTVQWSSVKINRIAGKKNDYTLVLERKDQKVELVVYPVLKGTDYDQAMKSYTSKMAAYTALLTGTKLYMAKTDGTILKQFKKAGTSFVYELLPAELVTLAKEKEDDPGIAIMNFAGSAKSELVVNQDIYYAPGAAEVQSSSMSQLDKIIASMKKSPSLKLMISSYTDSRGDDAFNMTLSQNRAQKVMEYFVAKGIDKSRITAKGFGETQLKNRCGNGVDCSEAEHKLNRRTEFKFMK